MTALDTDFLLCSAYKFYGPHVGILYARPGSSSSSRPDRLRTQEERAPERIETGTLNHAALAGVKAAIEYMAAWGDGATLRERIVSAVSAFASHEHALARRYDEEVRRIPGVRRWGVVFRRGPARPHGLDHDRRRDRGSGRAPARRVRACWCGTAISTPCARSRCSACSSAAASCATGFSMYNTAEEVDRLLDRSGEIARRPRDGAAAPRSALRALLLGFGTSAAPRPTSSSARDDYPGPGRPRRHRRRHRDRYAWAASARAASISRAPDGLARARPPVPHGRLGALGEGARDACAPLHYDVLVEMTPLTRQARGEPAITHVREALSPDATSSPRTKGRWPGPSPICRGGPRRRGASSSTRRRSWTASPSSTSPATACAGRR